MVALTSATITFQSLIIDRRYAFKLLLFNLDIDECLEELDNCDMICLNMEGSFACGCPEGYSFDVDGVTCIGGLL